VRKFRTFTNSQEMRGGVRLQTMSREEAEIYRSIIDEQIALQEMQAKLVLLERRHHGEAGFSTISQRIEHQRAVLSQLWEQARVTDAKF
jgi:hypothetical protein